MRHVVPAIALFAAFSSFAAAASENPHASCPFLGREELAGVGVTKDTAFIDSDWKWDEIPKEAPESKVITDMCTVSLKTADGNSSIVLIVDRFHGKVTEAQVGNWIKSAAELESKDAGITKTSFGDVTCETGTYELPTTQDSGDVKNINEFYVACDKQVGTHHISLNIHVPEAQKSTLPSAEQTKAMLEKSAERLKVASLGQRT